MRNRRRSRRSGFSPGAIVRIVLAAAAVLFVGWWAAKTAVVGELGYRNPFLARAVAPDDPRAAIRLAMFEFMVRNGRVSPESQRRAIDALRRSSLADEPFLLAAVSAAAAHDEAREEKLLTESRRRNPRSRFTRLLLLDIYLRHGRAEEAGGELAALNRLVEGAGGAVVPELGRLARDPKTRPGLARLLRRNPDIRDATLESLAANQSDTELVIWLARESGSGGDPRHPPHWQAVLLTRLVGAGDTARAYRLWQAATGAGGNAGSKGIYDPDFAGAPGAPPFNWELTSDAEGVAERAHGALQVDYYGRAQHSLARQLLMLAPGSYRLGFQAQGDAKGDGSQLAWSIACTGGKEPIALLPLKEVGSSPKAFSTAFTVPGGCGAQWLALDGKPGDVAAEQTATISKLRIVEGRR